MSDRTIFSVDVLYLTKCGDLRCASDIELAEWKLIREHGMKVPCPQRDLNLRDTETMREVIEALLGRKDDAGTH